MKFTTSLIKHSDISEEELIEIYDLKAIRWKYTLEQHKKWMAENIQPNDFHLIIKADQQPIGYTNLVDVNALINHGNVHVRGIGNVCTSETGKGFGNVLMEEMNVVLAQNQWKGVLLCKDFLVPYYEKFGWQLVDRKLIKTEKYTKVNFMTYNLKQIISFFEYNGRNF
jgi:predicted N-acetyltransferase YhbS